MTVPEALTALLKCRSLSPRGRAIKFVLVSAACRSQSIALQLRPEACNFVPRAFIAGVVVLTKAINSGGVELPRQRKSDLIDLNDFIDLIFPQSLNFCSRSELQRGLTKSNSQSY